MRKVLVTYSIDADIALSFASQFHSANRSAIIQGVIEKIVTLNAPTREERELQAIIDAAEADREQAMERKTAAIVELERLKADKQRRDYERDRAEKERFEMAVKIQRSTPPSKVRE